MFPDTSTLHRKHSSRPLSHLLPSISPSDQFRTSAALCTSASLPPSRMTRLKITFAFRLIGAKLLLLLLLLMSWIQRTLSNSSTQAVPFGACSAGCQRCWRTCKNATATAFKPCGSITNIGGILWAWWTLNRLSLSLVTCNRGSKKPLAFDFAGQRSVILSLA